MSDQTLEAIRSATRRAKRIEWAGFAVLSVLSLLISLLSFAATSGSL